MCDGIIYSKQKLIRLLRKNPPELFRALEQAINNSAYSVQNNDSVRLNEVAASTADNIEMLIKKINSMDNKATQVLFDYLTNYYGNID